MSLKTDLDDAIETLRTLYDPLTRFAWRAADAPGACGLADDFLAAANDLRKAINLVEAVRHDDVLILQAAEEIRQERESSKAAGGES
jgi:hypothetical protein